MRWTGLAIVALSAACTSVGARANPLFADIAQARSFVAASGDAIWPGFAAAPFDFLLVEPDRETLICRDSGVEGFVAGGVEPATGCLRFSRARSGLPDNILAAMPVFGPPSTVVMGTPASTGRSRAAWLRTILHEHFHQWVNALPGHYARIETLDLAGGDTTGMWMLNFPFPYRDSQVGAAYAAAASRLADAIDARGTDRFLPAFDAYLAARRQFAAAAGERNWRYWEFQLWNEGVARWTEIMYGRLYPDAEVQTSAARLETASRDVLRIGDTDILARNGRELAYPIGAAEAMLMDACGSEWRRAYPQAMALGPLLEGARRGCD